jgi:hypothetical protein
MKPQLSQTYNVDSRYSEAFVSTFINRMREEQKPEYGSDLGTEDKFIVNGPGSASYSFRNAFRAKQ